MQEFERLDEGAHGIHPGDAVPREESRVERITARQRRGVAHRDARPLLGAAGFERHQWLARRARRTRSTIESGHVGQTLDVQTDRCDAGICGQCFDHARHVDIGLVADGAHQRERQAAARHGEVAGDVARLRDNGNTALAGGDAVLVRPECRAGKAVHVAVAVGSHQWHASGGRQQFLLQRGVAGLGKAGGIDHGAAAALGSQRAHHLNRGFALHRHEGCIDGAVDVIHARYGGDAAQFRAPWVHRVQPSGKAELKAAFDRDGALTAADEGDGGGVQQAVEFVVHRHARAAPLTRPMAAAAHGR